MKIWRVVISTLLIISLTPTVAHADHVVDCQIPAIDLNAKQGVGWPRSVDDLPSIGERKFLILPIDFPDATSDISAIGNLRRRMELSNVEIFYNLVSSGLFKPIFDVQNEILRMPYPSSEYGQNLEQDAWNGTEFQSHHIVHDALIEYQRTHPAVNMKDYEAAVVVVTAGSSLSGRVAYALVDSVSQVGAMPGNIHESILVGLGALSVPEVHPGRMFVHEINHLLGVPDLYLYGENGYWQGKSTGPFGQQGYIRGIPSTESIAYNRWLRNWISDNRVACFKSIDSTKRFTLSPRGSTNGQYEMALHRIGQYSVLAIESPKEKGFGSMTFPRTVLVYTVDSSIKPGEGPIRLVPKIDAITSAPLSPDLPDWVRYKTAALKAGEHVVFGDLVILNTTKVTTGDVTSVAILAGADAKSKTITCIKGKLVKKIKGYLPSCPTGYKLKT